MDGDANNKAEARLRFQKQRFYARLCAVQALYQLEITGEMGLTHEQMTWFLRLAADTEPECAKYVPADLQASFASLRPLWTEYEQGNMDIGSAERQIELDDMKIAKEAEFIEKNRDEKFPKENKSMPLEEREKLVALIIDSKQRVAELQKRIEEQSASIEQHVSFKYMKQLVAGVSAERDALDEKIQQAAKNWRLGRMGKLDRCIIRLGAYEMLKVDAVSPATAINEAIELGKVFCQSETPRFINGVLDKIHKAG